MFTGVKEKIMEKNEIRELIKNKIFALNEQIENKRHNEEVSKKLEFDEYTQIVKKEIKQLIDFRDWLIDLHIDTLR